MIVRFPDRDFGDVTVEFDTDTGTAVYVFDSDKRRKACYLTKSAWVERLKEWRIDIQTLIAQQDYEVDVGL